MKRDLEVDGVFIGKIYDGEFKVEMIPEIQKRINEFLRHNGITKQMRSIVESDEVWIKPNLTNPRPPETGCITHPVATRALIDYLVSFLRVKNPIRIVETITYHKGAGMPEVLAKLPPSERAAIEDKIRHKDPDQDMHEFGFDLMLELSGIGSIVDEYKGNGVNIGILNLSKGPVKDADESKEIAQKVEQILGKESLPKDNIRRKILSNIPAVLGKKKIGLISLTLPKTHDEPEAQMTGAMKNIALGLYPQYKAFMHKELSKAMLYYYAFWKIGLGDRIFAITSGPLGQDCAGPIFGRAVNFPYIVAGSDPMKVDAATITLAFGNLDMAKQLGEFRYGVNKIGRVPSSEQLRKVIPYSLKFKPYPHEAR